MKKRKKKSLQIPTSALPDIVFMLLFFFMVTTVMRTNSEQLRIFLPQASELEKLTDLSVVGTIRIGTPIDSNTLGSADRIQLNDRIANVYEVGFFTEEKIESLPEELKRKYTTSIKADQNANMKTVTEVKQELRKVNALKLQYSTNTKQKDGS